MQAIFTHFPDQVLLLDGQLVQWIMLQDDEQFLSVNLVDSGPIVHSVVVADLRNGRHGLDGVVDRSI